MKTRSAGPRNSAVAITQSHFPCAKYRFQAKNILRCISSAISGDFTAAKYGKAAKCVLRCSISRDSVDFAAAKYGKAAKCVLRCSISAISRYFMVAKYSGFYSAEGFSDDSVRETALWRTKWQREGNRFEKRLSGERKGHGGANGTGNGNLANETLQFL